MHAALIDLGTNSIRYDLYQLSPQREPVRLHQEKKMIRLGENLFETGKISEKAFDRLMQALEHFDHLSEQHHVDKTWFFATSAMREAKNQAEIKSKIWTHFRWKVQVLTGDGEAELIARGILYEDTRCQGRFGLIDIGGGSTEISFCENQSILSATSLPLGVARLEQTFLKTSPPQTIKTAIKHIHALLTDHPKHFECEKTDRFLGSSGTIKCLSKVHKRIYGSRKIQFSHLSTLRHEMQTMSKLELSQIPGMDEKRVDLILAGTLILEGVMEFFHIPLVEYSRFALRDGILVVANQEAFLGKKDSLFDSMVKR